MNDFFDKHKALIIATLFMALFVLSLHNIALSNQSESQKELLLELQAMDYLAEQIPEEIPEPILESKVVSAITKTHQAFNHETKMDQEAFEQRLSELNQKLSAGSKSVSESADSESGTEDIAEKTTEEKKDDNTRGKGNEKAKTTIKESANHDSSISYSLVKRKASKLPNPVYTCSNRGKIVVNIVVNNHGHVIRSEINTAASNSNNGCLHDSALKYANRAQFDVSDRAQQLGSITYLFNY